MTTGKRRRRRKPKRKRRGRWVTRAVAAGVLDVAVRTVDRRRKDLNPGGDLRVLRQGRNILVWIPVSVEQTPRALMREMQRRLAGSLARQRELEEDLRRGRALVGRLYSGLDVSLRDPVVEDWLSG